MNKMCSITALSFFVAVISAHATDIMKAFPPAEEGMVRYVLQLPKQNDESIFMVELIVGQTVQVDEKNRSVWFLKNSFETKKKLNRFSTF